MISPEITIRRSSGLWGGVSPQTVETYRIELEDIKKQLGDFSFQYEHTLLGSKDMMAGIQAAITEEISYCLFYYEYQEKKSEIDFEEWVFTKQEDIKAKDTWNPPPGEQWTKTNGRVKAIIQFDRTGKMVKLTLHYENDSSNLRFVDPSRYNNPKVFHVKSEASIKNKIQELKEEADAFFNDHLYPLYSQYDIDLLKQLLWTS